MRAWRADRPLESYPDATRENNPGTGSGARSRAKSWDATRKARAPSAGSPCHEPRPGTRSVDTTDLTNNAARQHCTVWPNALARHFQAQVIQARERAQVGAIKGSIGHVEVFQMDGVGTPIIGRPRPLHNHDTPNPTQHTYTLKCEEPV